MYKMSTVCLHNSQMRCIFHMRVYVCASPDLMSANAVIAKYRDNVDLQSYGAVTRATATTKRPQFTFGGGCRILPLFNFFVRQHSRTVPLPQIATQNPFFFFGWCHARQPVCRTGANFIRTPQTFRLKSSPHLVPHKW